jgi:aerobic-type carbon monoxide dehydrogenase small subunit (CoxS/CutS family)
MPQFELRINGKTHQVEGAADDSLLSVLRYELNLTGSKFGCGEGQCGACTVLVDGLAVRSCVTRIGPVAGKAVTTIEAIANGDALHPVQEAFVETDAFQCGYCTSGMVMATIGLLRTTPNPSDAEIARLLDRNVCRCGTYPRIVKAIKLAVEKNRQAGVRVASTGSGTTPSATTRSSKDSAAR